MGRGGYGGVTWSNLQPTTFGCYSLLNSMARCVFVIGLLYMFVALGMFKDIFASVIKLICCLAMEEDTVEGCLDPAKVICIIFRIILGVGYFFIGFLLFKNAGDGNGKCTCGMVGCAPKVFLLVMAVLQAINFMIWLWVQIQCFLVNESVGDFADLVNCFSIFGVGLDMKGIYICVIVFCYGNESGSPMFGKAGGGGPKGGASGSGFGGQPSKTGTHASGTRGANSVQPMPADEEAQAKDTAEDKPNDPMMSEATEENRSTGGGGGTPAGGSLKKKPNEKEKHKKRKSKVK